MREVMVMVKNTIKLLLRNKGFLFLMVGLPLLSILILDIHDVPYKEKGSNQNELYMLSKMSEQICYDVKSTMLPVKLYDSSQDACGMTFANELAEAGIFQIFYCNTKGETEEAIQKDIERTAKMDRVNAIIYLTPEFTKELRAGELIHGLTLYDSDSDERNETLKKTIQQMVGGYIQAAAQCPKEMDIAEVLQKSGSLLPARKVVVLESADRSKLSDEQDQQLRRIGYVLAMLSISFLFSGVMIADTVIKERQYKVFSRIQLTEVTPVQYVISKYIVCIVSVILQVLITGIGVSTLVFRDYAISKVNLVLIIGLIGIVFNTMSLCIGMLCNNIMNTNYLGFIIWSVSCLLSGCYFDLSSAGKTIRGLSNLMPQKWGLDCVTQIMLGNTQGYGTLLVTTAAFLLVIGTGAVIGTRHSVEA